MYVTAPRPKEVLVSIRQLKLQYKHIAINTYYISRCVGVREVLDAKSDPPPNPLKVIGNGAIR